EPVNLGRRAEAEVWARVVLRGVAATADYVAALSELARGDVDNRAGRVARTLARGVADELEAEPVVLRVRDVAQDGRRGVHVVDDEVEATVAVEVCDGEAAAAPSLGQT